MTDELLTWREACDLLKIGRTKLYALPIRRVRVGTRGTRWPLSDVRLYIALNTERRRGER